MVWLTYPRAKGIDGRAQFANFSLAAEKAERERQVSLSL
jgi:hypothetical protein